MNALLVLVVVVFSCGYVQGHHRTNCMEPMGKMNFDHDKFSGAWFVVAKAATMAVPPPMSTCSKLDYSANEHGNTTHVTLRVTMKTDDKPVVFLSKGQPLDPHIGSAVQAVWKKEEDDKWMAVFTQSILATDYEDFALLYICRPIYDEKEDVFDKAEVLEVLSRKPNMDSTLLGVLKNILKGFDLHVNTDVDNSGC